MNIEPRTTLFYVDDNPRSSQLLAGVLEQCGFTVITANDPVEALRLCKKISFDLALLDYEMPQMTGAQLAQEMKFLLPDIPVVLISGYTNLPATELLFADAHFGFGTSLDDLLWTMRVLVRTPVPVVADNHSTMRNSTIRNSMMRNSVMRSSMARNADST